MPLYIDQTVLSRAERGFMEILAQRLCALRKERKLSRKDVSERLEIAERTYQRYENAEREPTASVLIKMADFYGVTIDYLVGRTEERT